MRWSSLAITAARGSALPCMRVLAGAATGAGVGAAAGELLVLAGAATHRSRLRGGWQVVGPAVGRAVGRAE